ncbi:MAG: rod shape-determining protein [Clostridium sp.]|nr:rod shape-determining protein [Clostridium sp.]
MDFSKYAGQTVFGLDIGTRSIVGTVGYRSGEQFIVIAQKSVEHETRSMLDGQIHDIAQVGATISLVREELQKSTGLTLTDVCIAAAGRVLRTERVRVGIDYEEEHDVTEEDIYGLEALGVEKAYRQFSETNETQLRFYCVGSTVIKYYLNDYPIGNLENHRARKIEVEMIATFLPDEVVDGLYKAVGIAGLQVVNLTLEPIAAIQVAIPQMYRMLNIALVDVGAGTSDISITKEGSIVAYGMIPVAGDSLTEVVAEHCLVDFNTAEQIKRGICEKESVTYRDIMGLEQSITRADALAVMQERIDTMAKLAADKIKELNGGKSVSAVFVVGGGGKILGYEEALAKELDIVKERVALRGEEVMQKIRFVQEDVKKDSLLVTPIGICLCFYEQGNHFIHVTFNHKRVKLYDNSHLAVVDAAMQADFPNADMFPKRGEELVFELDGKTRRIRGEAGEAAVIHVNGAPADITTPIHANDMIDVEPSTAGAPASCMIGKLPEYHATLRIRVNGKEIDLPKYAQVNGTLQSEYYEIGQDDVIEINNFYTVEQLKQFLELENGTRLLVNHMPADERTRVYENFSVEWGEAASAVYAEEFEEESWLTDEERAERGLPARNGQDAYEDAPRPAMRRTAMPSASMFSSASMPQASSEGQNAGAEQTAAGQNAGAGQAAAGQSAGTEQAAEGQGTEGTQTTVGQNVGAGQNAGADQTAIGQGAESAQVTFGQRAGAGETASGAEGTAQSAQNGGAPPFGQAGTVQSAQNGRTPPFRPAGSAQTGQNAGAETKTVTVMVNGDPVTMSGKKNYIYVDVFDYIDFDLSTPHGSCVVTKRNGENAGYVDVLSDGDQLEIYWEK